jgi:glycosyltransferase 2 family protein
LNKKVKSVIQYAGMILITGLLLWLSLRNLAVSDSENRTDVLWSAWKSADKFYLMLMVVAVMISHVLRAERWRMLLRPTGNRISLAHSFLSLMIGYLVNLAVPRGGEVSRCYNLFKLEKTPIEVSFGTVVVERIVDLLCLVVLIILSFIAEWTKLSAFIDGLNMPANQGSGTFMWLIIAVLGGLGLVILIILFRRNEKVIRIWKGFRAGLVAIFQLKRKGLFIFYSFLIWALYFVMSYMVLLAFKETEDLGLSAVLTIFAIGSIAMALPLPGGAGSYHTLVPLGLVMLYQVAKADAIAFVFIFHGWQTLVMIVGGVVSLIISYWIIRWKQQPQK